MQLALTTVRMQAWETSWFRDPSLVERISEARRYVLQRAGDQPVDVAVVLGSGLNDKLLPLIREPTIVEFGEIPHMPLPSVAGHRGKICFGWIGRLRVAAIAGRLHMYEGVSFASSCFTTLLVAACGARVFLATNAAGGALPGMHAGSLMAVDDHIRFSRMDPVGELFTSVRLPSEPEPCVRYYDEMLLSVFAEASVRCSVPVFRGTYAWMLGPAYETAAETGAGARRCGVGAFGMSTVPEVLVAHFLGLRVAGLCFISNIAVGMSTDGHRLNHEDVQNAARSESDHFSRLLAEWFSVLDQQVAADPGCLLIGDRNIPRVPSTTACLAAPADRHGVTQCRCYLSSASVAVPLSADANVDLVNWSQAQVNVPHHAPLSSTAIMLFPTGSFPSPSELVLCSLGGALLYSFFPCNEQHADETQFVMSSWSDLRQTDGDRPPAAAKMVFRCANVSLRNSVDVLELQLAEVPMLQNVIPSAGGVRVLLIAYCRDAASWLQPLPPGWESSASPNGFCFSCWHSDSGTFLLTAETNALPGFAHCKGVLRSLAKLDCRPRLLLLLVEGVSADGSSVDSPTSWEPVRDHLNFSGWNVLVGPHDDRFGPRFVDLSQQYAASGGHGSLLALSSSLQISTHERLLWDALGATAITRFGIADAVAAQQLGLPTSMFWRSLERPGGGGGMPELLALLEDVRHCKAREAM